MSDDEQEKSGASSPSGLPAPLLGYATPMPLAQSGDVLRDGMRLVVRDKVTLPERCVLCGDEAEGDAVMLAFSWDTSFQVTRVAKLQLREKGAIRAYLCRRHRRRWNTGRRLGVAGMVGSLVVMLAGLAVGVVSESSDVPRYTGHGIAVTVTGFGTMIVSLFFFTLRTRTLSCVRIEGGYLHLEGAAEGFLNGLAEVPAEMKGNI